MDKSSIQCLFFFLLTIFFTYVTCLSGPISNNGEVEDEREFSYELNQENGPDRWGKLKPEWQMCGKGDMQSPIDLTHDRVRLVSNLGELAKDHRPSNATLKNRGHDLMLRFEEGSGSIKINGIDFQLLQLHWHSPSEHTINGRRFALELHMVHENNGTLAVVAVLYQIGGPDKFLGLLENKLSVIIEKKETVEKNIGMIDPRDIEIGSRQYYRYLGSLTTPPCTQNVTWTIVKEARNVTENQVSLLRTVVHDNSDSNARPVQPINTRVVKLFRPKEV